MVASTPHVIFFLLLEKQYDELVDQICERIPAGTTSLEERRKQLLASLDPEKEEETWGNLYDVLKSKGDTKLANTIASAYIGKALQQNTFLTPHNHNFIERELVPPDLQSENELLKAKCETLRKTMELYTKYQYGFHLDAEVRKPPI